MAVVFVGSSSASLARDYSDATCGEGFDLSSLDEEPEDNGDDQE